MAVSKGRDAQEERGQDGDRSSTLIRIPGYSDYPDAAQHDR